MDSTSVVFVHSSLLFADALATTLTARFKLACIASDLEQVPFELLQDKKASIFMVGGWVRETTSKVILSIRERLPSAIIVVIGDTTELQGVLTAFKAGANGYLREAMTSQTLVTALELALHEEIILPPEAAAYLRSQIGSQVEIAPSNEPQQSLEPEFFADLPADSVPYRDGKVGSLQKTILRSEPHLSAREVVILQGLADGLPNKVIANTLAITEGTVKVHVKAVLRKIQAKNRTQAAVWAVKNLPGSSMRH